VVIHHAINIGKDADVRGITRTTLKAIAIEAFWQIGEML